MTYTENHHLPTWEKSDRVMMDTFNAMTAALDAAIPRIVTGTYTGTGQSGESGKCTLNLGFQPKLVFVVVENAYLYPPGAVLAYPASVAICDHELHVEWSASGVSWWGETPTKALNGRDSTYRYLAIP